MAVSGTSAMSNAVQALYQDDYLDVLNKSMVWMKAVKWMAQFGGSNLHGSSFNFPVGHPLDRVTSDLSETADVTPVQGKQSNIQVTLNERGNAIEKTTLLDIESYPDMGRIFAAEVAQNQASSLDYLVAAAVLAGTYVVYPSGVSARSSLNVTNHKPTYTDILNLYSRAVGFGTPTFDDGSLMAIVNQVGIAELSQITELESVAEYSDPGIIYDGESGLSGKRFPGERFKIANIRFVEHPYGKVYLSAGSNSAYQAADTLNGDVAAGATSITLTSGSGIAAGDWLTLGTVESSTTRYPTTEQVYVTDDSSSPTFTIQGGGNALGNEGTVYAHSSGAAVTEADNVFSIPVIGPNSIVGMYATETGKEGQQQVHPKGGQIIEGRFYDYAWWWIGGVKAISKWCVRGEFATRVNTYGHS